MRIAIQQPTFLPWVGWFDIMDQVEQLVLLDDVAFSKQSWQQRNRLRTPSGLEFVTVPVRSAGRLGQPIREVELADSRFPTRLEKTVRTNYGRARFFEEYFEPFRAVVAEASGSRRLSVLNEGLIGWLADALGVTTPTVRSGEVDADGVRGAYVAALCAGLHADEYLSPVGSEGYLLDDADAFFGRDIRVWLHEYVHPQYSQVFQPFMPYASTLDLLFNTGPSAGAIMRTGRRVARPLAATPRTHFGADHDP